MKYILGIIAAILVIAAGYFIGLKQRLPQPENQAPAKMNIYFLKPDGLYQILSDKEGEEKLLEGQFDNLESANGKLILASESALMTYDLTSGQAATVQPEVGTVHFSAAVSPTGSHLAYTKSIEVTDVYGFKNELWLLDLASGERQKLLSEPELGADPEGVYYLFRLNRWLSDQQLLVGRSYESVSYCPFTVGVDTKLAEECVGFGSQQIGLSDIILTADNGVAYGVKRIFYPEFGLSGDQTGIYSQQGSNRQFLTSDEASSLVKSGDVLYMTKILSGNNYQPVQADLFSLNLRDESTQRLTHDATSVDTKENLRLSNKGRFLTYDSQEISTEKTRAWIYDLKLNQYYSIGDNTFSALVIEN